VIAPKWRNRLLDARAQRDRQGGRMKDELGDFKRERERNIEDGKSVDICVYFCQRCGKVSTEKVPKSEGWQPFSLYSCDACGADAGSFLGYAGKEE